MSKKVAYYGIFVALAILFGYVESVLPFVVPIPGAKLGLGNIIILMAMYYIDRQCAFFISIIRIVISGLLFKGFAGVLYSMCGGLLSLMLMVLVKNIKWLSMVGVSIIGGITHNIGQLIAAGIVIGNFNIFYYWFAPLIAIGAVTGLMTGIVAKYTLSHLSNMRY